MSTEMLYIKKHKITHNTLLSNYATHTNQLSRLSLAPSPAPYKAYFDRTKDIIIDSSIKKLATTNTFK